MRPAFRSKLPAGQVNIMRSLVRTATNLGLTRLFIVGAQARDLIFAGRVRLARASGDDIGFGIGVETVG